MTKRLKENEVSVHFDFVMPRPLYSRLVQRAGKETVDSGSRVSSGEICRAALEEYLDLYEGATFVKDAPAKQDAAAVPETPKANG